MTSRFDDEAREWDTHERLERARAIADVIRRHVPLEASMRLVDIGAGTGLLGIEFASDVAEVVLAEPSTGMLGVAREKLGASGPRNVAAVEFDLTGGSIPGPAFDVAVSLLVLHHVADTRAALQGIHALLARGGWVALIDLDAEDGSFHDDPEGIHHEGFEREEIVRLAAEVGFEDLATATALELERDGRIYPLFLLTGRRS